MAPNTRKRKPKSSRRGRDLSGLVQQLRRLRSGLDEVCLKLRRRRGGAELPQDCLHSSDAAPAEEAGSGSHHLSADPGRRPADNSAAIDGD
uniref:BHLH domain-containing protein n=1 Tax=Steinernema glaseri TaxID=37863 RepID=A0A1I7YSQ2_9BILA